MLFNVIFISVIAIAIWGLLTFWIVKRAVKNAISESAETIARVIIEAREGRVYTPPAAGPATRAIHKPSPADKP